MMVANTEFGGGGSSGGSVYLTIDVLAEGESESAEVIGKVADYEGELRNSVSTITNANGWGTVRNRCGCNPNELIRAVEECSTAINNIHESFSLARQWAEAFNIGQSLELATGDGRSYEGDGSGSGAGGNGQKLNLASTGAAAATAGGGAEVEGGGEKPIDPSGEGEGEESSRDSDVEKAEMDELLEDLRGLGKDPDALTDAEKEELLGRLKAAGYPKDKSQFEKIVNEFYDEKTLEDWKNKFGGYTDQERENLLKKMHDEGRDPSEFTDNQIQKLLDELRKKENEGKTIDEILAGDRDNDNEQNERDSGEKKKYPGGEEQREEVLTGDDDYGDDDDDPYGTTGKRYPGGTGGDRTQFGGDDDTGGNGDNGANGGNGGNNRYPGGTGGDRTQFGGDGDKGGGTGGSGGSGGNGDKGGNGNKYPGGEGGGKTQFGGDTGGGTGGSGSSGGNGGNGGSGGTGGTGGIGGSGGTGDSPIIPSTGGGTGNKPNVGGVTGTGTGGSGNGGKSTTGGVLAGSLVDSTKRSTVDTSSLGESGAIAGAGANLSHIAIPKTGVNSKANIGSGTVAKSSKIAIAAGLGAASVAGIIGRQAVMPNLMVNPDDDDDDDDEEDDQIIEMTSTSADKTSGGIGLGVAAEAIAGAGYLETNSENKDKEDSTEEKKDEE